MIKHVAEKAEPTIHSVTSFNIDSFLENQALYML